MRAYDAGRWLLLATLWSLQFIFLRVAVPVFGMAAVAEGRALFAALFVLPWAVFIAREQVGGLLGCTSDGSAGCWAVRVTGRRVAGLHK